MIRPTPTPLAGRVLACPVAVGDATAERIADERIADEPDPRPRLTDSRAYPACRREAVGGVRL